MKDPIVTYLQSIWSLCNLFVDAYYTFDDWSKADYDIIGDLNIWMWPIHINGYYRSIDNIICAIRNKIPEKILFKHYEESLKAYENKESFPNLYNYWKQHA